MVVDERNTGNLEILERILTEIEGSEIGETVSEIAKNLGMSRITIAKYLDHLVEEDKVKVLSVGAYKLYRENSNTRVASNILKNLRFGVITQLRGALARVEPKVDYKQLLEILASEIVDNLESPLGFSKSDLANHPTTRKDLAEISKYARELVRCCLVPEPFARVEKIVPLVQDHEGIILLRVSQASEDPKYLNDYLMFTGKLIQTILRKSLGREIFFTLHNIRENTAFFRLGFVEKYTFKVSIAHKRRQDVPEEIYLAFLETFFCEAPFSVRNGGKGKTSYIFLETEDLLAMESFIERVARRLELTFRFQEMGYCGVREWIHYGEWTEEPFLTIKGVANHDKFARVWDIGKKAYPLLGLNIYWEFIEGGYLIHCKDEFDFLYGFTPMGDLNRRFELVRQVFGGDDTEFKAFMIEYRNLNEQITEFLARYQEKVRVSGQKIG